MLARAECGPILRAITAANGYVALTGDDRTAAEATVAQRWNLPILRRLTGHTEESPTGVGA